MVLCAITDVEPQGVIQLPTSAALGWVNAMLGGNRAIGIPERTLTPIEHALVQGLMNDALEDLQYSLGPLLTHSIRVDAIQYNSQFAQAAPTSELMIVARFTVRVGEDVTDATVALPARVLLEQLGETNPTGPAENVKQLLHAQLAQVPITVTARLAPANVTPASVLGMKIGDVIPLPHPTSRPLHVAAGGQIIASAAVGATGSRLAIVVTTSQENN
jgi:flagellar motor switch protein FliM